MEKASLLSFVSLTDGQLSKLQAVSPHLEILQQPEARAADLSEEIRRRVEILYGQKPSMLDAHLFPRLKWIQLNSAGFDYMRSNPVWQLDLPITTVRGIHIIPVSELALALIFAFRWKLRDLLRFQARAEWPQNRWEIFFVPELYGSTIGIVGYGVIGRELARQAQALGMRVLVVNHSGRRYPMRDEISSTVGDPEAAIPEKIYPTSGLLDMLPECDYVVAVAPSTDQSRHLFDTEAFAQMKRSAVFINVGRGALVDEAALIAALCQGQIAGAGLDVFEEEPLPASSPLWQMDNVILAPHIGGISARHHDRACEVLAENLRRYFHHEPLLNLVDRVRGY